MKIATLLYLLIYSQFVRTPFSWAARHTTVCLDMLNLRTRHSSAVLLHSHCV